MSGVQYPWEDTEAITAMIARMDAFERTGYEILMLPVTYDCPACELVEDFD